MVSLTEEVVARVGWSTTCKLACKAMIAGCSLDQMYEYALRAHLNNLNAYQATKKAKP